MNVSPPDEPDPYLIPLSEDGVEALSVNRASIGAWAAYYSPYVDQANARVLVRIGPEAGPPSRPSPTGGTTWNPADLTGQPLEVRELHVAAAPDTGTFTSQLLREIPFLRIEAGVNYPTHRQVLNDLIAAPNALMVGAPEGWRFMLRPGPCPPSRPDLEVGDPGGYRKPDSFYRQVGVAFLWLAAMSSAPAQQLAAVNGVPVGTVHRWVREAKLRGLLRLPMHGRKEG
jgi:hypothetical protein